MGEFFMPPLDSYSLRIMTDLSFRWRDFTDRENPEFIYRL